MTQVPESPHPSARFVGNAVAGETLSAFEWATARTRPDAKVARLAADYLARFVRRPEPAPASVDDPLSPLRSSTIASTGGPG